MSYKFQLKASYSHEFPVFGMGLDLALILGIMGTVWTGNPLSLNPGFSIGGTHENQGADNILGNLLGLLGMCGKLLNLW